MFEAFVLGVGAEEEGDDAGSDHQEGGDDVVVEPYTHSTASHGNDEHDKEHDGTGRGGKYLRGDEVGRGTGGGGEDEEYAHTHLTPNHVLQRVVNQQKHSRGGV